MAWRTSTLDYRNVVPTDPGQTRTPLLDEWIAEVGEEQLVAEVRAAVRAIEDGTLPRLH